MATAETLIAQPQAVQGTQIAAKMTARQFWYQYVRSLMEPLLQLSGSYTPEQVALHLKFLADHVIPTFGPLPSEPHGPYAMSYVDSPFEPSINLTSAGKTKVRYGFEVVKPAGGASGSDPYGEDRAREVLPLLAKACGADTQWLQSAINTFFLTPAETDLIKNAVPTFMPSSLVSFDLDGDKTMMKVYIMAMRKAIATGSPSSNEFLLNGLRKLEPYGDKLGPGLDVVAEYLAGAQYDVTLTFVGLDCIDPTVNKDARAKVYMHTKSNSFAVASDVMTLGGRLKDETSLKRVEVMRSIWPLLRNEQPGQGPDPSDEAWDTWEKPERVTGTPFSGLQYNIELNPSKPELETKCYIPLFQHNATAQESEANMDKILQTVQHEWGRTGKYSSVIATTYGKDRVAPTFLSYSYSKKKGAYMSAYVPGAITAGAEMDAMKAGDWEYF